MNTTDLQTFIIRAKKATYVGDGAKAQSSRLGAHDLTFDDGAWSYRDSYFGSIDFIGQETVWLNTKPVWSMCYYGTIIRPALITAEEAGTMIKEALSRDEAQGRLLDNFEHGVGVRRYKITSEGTVSHFKGRETIHVNGQLAYALDYFGGLIKE